MIGVIVSGITAGGAGGPEQFRFDGFLAYQPRKHTGHHRQH
ncbi:hypothetical protein VT930_09360 [Mycobacterium sherrisii]|nr:hypothetical protein [Mycobacterium sherrisii]MEC4763311.1 hypothetical protein [Mycobacterium sherrisii]